MAFSVRIDERSQKGSKVKKMAFLLDAKTICLCEFNSSHRKLVPLDINKLNVPLQMI